MTAAADRPDDDLAAAGGVLGARLGARFAELDASRAVMTCPVPAGNGATGAEVHAIAAVLIETVGSMLAATAVGPERLPVGVDINISFHEAEATGMLTATGWVLGGSGRRLTSAVGVIDDAGRRIADGRLTCLVRPAMGPPPRG